MSKPDPSARFRKVVALVKAGKSADEIRAELSMTAKQLNSDLGRARHKGLLPFVRFSNKARAVEQRLTRRKSRFGRTQDIFEVLTPEQTDWLVNQVPRGSSLIELTCSIIIDAYNEEKENGR